MRVGAIDLLKIQEEILHKFFCFISERVTDVPFACSRPIMCEKKKNFCIPINVLY